MNKFTKEDIAVLQRVSELVKTLRTTSAQLATLWNDSGLTETIDSVLNPYYPIHTLSSFDEFSASLPEWEEDVQERVDYILHNLEK